MQNNQHVLHGVSYYLSFYFLYKCFIEMNIRMGSSRELIWNYYSKTRYAKFTSLIWDQSRGGNHSENKLLLWERISLL